MVQLSDAVYNTASYFKYDYEDEWIIDPFVKEMIQDVDKLTVLDSGVIDSPVLGKIPPTGLSGGVKTLILVKFDKDKIFNVSTCGDNCAKWLLKIAESEDRTINLLHLMDFGPESFSIHILNAKRGGDKLIGRSLLDCHNQESRDKIQKVVDWFGADESHNLVYTFHNEKQNKDVYMVALREEGRLIGYYEKHEYRNAETMKQYDLW